MKKQSSIPLQENNRRATLINVKFHDRVFTVVQAYAPTSCSTEKEIEDFYESLVTTIDKSMSNLILYGKRNDTGEKCIYFCYQHNLKITNTMFKKPPELRWN